MLFAPGRGIAPSIIRSAQAGQVAQVTQAAQGARAKEAGSGTDVAEEEDNPLWQQMFLRRGRISLTIGPELAERLFPQLGLKAPIKVQGSAQGPTSNLVVNLAVVFPDGSVLSQGRVNADADPPSYDFDVEVVQVNPESLIEGAPSLDLSMDFRVQGVGFELAGADVGVVVQGGSVTYEEVTADIGRAQVRLANGVLSLEESQVAVASARLGATGQAQLEPAGPFSFTMTLAIPKLADLPIGDEQAAFSGDLSLRMNIDGALPNPPQDEPLEFQLRINGRSDRIEGVEGQAGIFGLSFNLNVSGTAEEPLERAQGNANVERVQAGPVALSQVAFMGEVEGREGRLEGVATLPTGVVVESTVIGDLDDDMVLRIQELVMGTAQWRWRQVGDLRVGPLNQMPVALSGLDLRQNGQRVTADLLLGEDPSGEVGVMDLDLGEIVAQLAPDLGLPDSGWLDARIQFDLGDEPMFLTDGNLRALDWRGVLGLSLQWQSQYQDELLTLSATLGRPPAETIQVEARLPVAIGADDPPFRTLPGKLAVGVDVDFRVETLMALAGVLVPFRTGMAGQVVRRSELIDGVRVPYRSAADGEGDQPVPVLQWVSPTVGHVVGSFQVEGTWANPNLEARGEVQALRFHVDPREFDGTWEAKSADGETELVLRLDAEHADGDGDGIDADRWEGNVVRAQVQVETDLGQIVSSEGPGMDSALDGSIWVDGFPLDGLLVIVPEVRDAAGRLFANVQMSGTVADPVAEGMVAVREGRVYLDAFSRALEDIEIEARFNLPGQIVVETLQARSWDGRLRGSAVVSTEGLWPSALSLDLRADDFGLVLFGVPVAELNGNIGGEFQILPGEGEIPPSIQGAIEIRNGRVNILEFPTDVQDLDPHPEILVGTPPPELPEPDEPLPDLVVPPWEFPFLSLLVAVTIVDSLLVESNELFLPLTGGVIMGVGYQEPIVLAGDIQALRGRTTVLGAVFDLEEMEFSFLGQSPPNPSLFIVATRDTLLGRVQIQIDGPLRSATASLTSDQAMTETQIASLIFLGRPDMGPVRGPMPALVREDPALVRTPGTEVDLPQLPGFVSAFVLAGVQRAMGFRLPLDVLEFAAGGRGDAQFVVGKFFTPRLLVEYSFIAGVADDPRISTNEVTFQYVLSPQVLVETQVGDAGTGGMRLVYVIQF